VKHWLLALVLCGSACSVKRTNLVSDNEAGAVQLDAGAAHDSGVAHGDAGANAASAHIPSARCGKAACACDDGLDNDGDGLIDGLDPECTGSFDADESSFAIGKPNKRSGCRDCFWDDSPGLGHGCRYPSECLRGQAPPSNGACTSCDVGAGCIDECLDRTPNGCDCFGCCEVMRPDGTSLFIELADTCSMQKLHDEQACPRCVQNTQCLNPCGRCELCIGRTDAQLPPDCSGSRSDYSCDQGQVVCASSNDCVGASYCQLGCCLVDLL
jgi:hypothetical protein